MFAPKETIICLAVVTHIAWDDDWHCLTETMLKRESIMTTFVMLTRVAHDELRSPEGLEDLEEKEMDTFMPHFLPLLN